MTKFLNILAVIVAIAACVGFVALTLVIAPPITFTIIIVAILLFALGALLMHVIKTWNKPY